MSSSPRRPPTRPLSRTARSRYGSRRGLRCARACLHARAHVHVHPLSRAWHTRVCGMRVCMFMCMQVQIGEILAHKKVKLDDLMRQWDPNNNGSVRRAQSRVTRAMRRAQRAHPRCVASGVCALGAPLELRHAVRVRPRTGDQAGVSHQRAQAPRLAPSRRRARRQNSLFESLLLPPLLPSPSPAFSCPLLLSCFNHLR